jgi:hypothetical protein
LSGDDAEPFVLGAVWLKRMHGGTGTVAEVARPSAATTTPACDTHLTQWWPPASSTTSSPTTSAPTATGRLRRSRPTGSPRWRGRPGRARDGVRAAASLSRSEGTLEHAPEHAIELGMHVLARASQGADGSAGRPGRPPDGARSRARLRRARPGRWWPRAPGRPPAVPVANLVALAVRRHLRAGQAQVTRTSTRTHSQRQQESGGAPVDFLESGPGLCCGLLVAVGVIEHAGRANRGP